MPNETISIIPNKVKDSCPGRDEDVVGSTEFAAHSSSPQGDVSDTLAPRSWGMRHVSGTVCDEDENVFSRNFVVFSVTMIPRVRLAMQTAAATAVSCLLSLSNATSNDILTGSCTSEEVEDRFTASVTTRSCRERSDSAARQASADCITLA